MKLVIDSNIFVSSLDPKDLFYSDCSLVFKKLLRSEIQALCPLLVLVETICVIRRRTNSEVASKVYHNLIQVPSINWLTIDIETAKKACVLGCKIGLKGGDIVILQAAEQYNIPLLSNDKEIKSKTLDHILVFEPKDFLKNNEPENWTRL